MVIIRDSTNGKKEDFMLLIPKIPKMTNAAITMLTATGNLIKYAIIFLILLS
jgi:hypothetical protein